MYFQPDIVALEQHMLRCKAVQRRHADGGSDDRPTEEDGPLTTADTGGKDTRDNKPFRCTRCGRSYPLAQSLQRHRWKCDQSRPMPCPLCGAIFFRADNLSGHMRSVHRKDSRSPLESTKGPVA